MERLGARDAIGPLTNLILLAVTRPGSLSGGPVVAMGGWTQPPADGLPASPTTC